jgi:hypothetical protein
MYELWNMNSIRGTVCLIKEEKNVVTCVQITKMVLAIKYGYNVNFCFSIMSWGGLLYLRNKSWKPECVLSFYMGWRILVFYPERFLITMLISQNTFWIQHFYCNDNNLLLCRCHGCSINTIDFPVVKVYVDDLSSARIWQHTLCATFSANVNINDRLPIVTMAGTTVSTVQITISVHIP